jgi:hypothetical protein
MPDWIACQQQGLNGVRLIGHLTRRRVPEEGQPQMAGEGGLGDHSSSAQALSDKMIYRIIGEALERAEQLMRKKGMNRDAETFAGLDALAATHVWAACDGRRRPGEHRPSRPRHASLATTTRYTSADTDEAWGCRAEVHEEAVVMRKENDENWERQ